METNKELYAPRVDPETPYDIIKDFHFDEKIGKWKTIIGQFIITLETSTLICKSSTLWLLRDLNGHTLEENKKVYSTYHFEVCSNQLLPVGNLKLFVTVELMNSTSKRSSTVMLRVDETVDDILNLKRFDTWCKDRSTRFYKFTETHQVFYEESLHGRLFKGFSFSIQNCHVDDKIDGPVWNVVVDMSKYINKAAPDQFVGLESTPIRSDYGVGIEPRHRAQGEPFWEQYRKGKITKSLGVYRYTPIDEYKNAKWYERNRVGGSGAYKWAGKEFASKGDDGRWKIRNIPPDKPIEGNCAMRMGSLYEESVMLTYLMNTQAHTKVSEYGWNDFASDVGHEKYYGASPDGIITDPSMTIDIVPARRLQTWKDAGVIPGDIDNFDSGLLEIKCSRRNDNMMDYYRIQCIWGMMIFDVYWAHLVKFQVDGTCRVYTMYRDFVHEEKLKNLIRDTRERVGKGIDYFTAIRHNSNKEFIKSMWGSARWYNEHQDMSSVVIKWDKPEITNYFKYKKNVYEESRLKWGDVDLSRPTLLLKYTERPKRRKFGDAECQYIETLRQSTNMVMDAIKDENTNRSQLFEHIRSCVDLLTKLMEIV